MDQLLTAVEQQLGAAWVEAVEWLRDQNHLEAVEERVRSGDLQGAVIGVEQAAERFAGVAAEAYAMAGKAAAAWLDGLVPSKLITFDAANPRAVRWAQMNRATLVREITQQQAQVIGNLLTDATRLSINPRVWARDLRDSIGLTAYQDNHVATYRRALETGDFDNALGRQLRDARSDRSVLAAIENARPLPPEQVDSMVERYRANWVSYRSEVIARTEGLRVLHQGTEEGIEQALDGGVIDARQLVQFWNAHHDARTRRSHYAMDGQPRAWDEPFISGNGVELRYPGDPDAPSDETLQCRCNRSMRLLSVEEAARVIAADPGI